MSEFTLGCVALAALVVLSLVYYGAYSLAKLVGNAVHDWLKREEGEQ